MICLNVIQNRLFKLLLIGSMAFCVGITAYGDGTSDDGHVIRDVSGLNVIDILPDHNQLSFEAPINEKNPLRVQNISEDQTVEFSLDLVDFYQSNSDGAIHIKPSSEGRVLPHSLRNIVAAIKNKQGQSVLGVDKKLTLGPGETMYLNLELKQNLSPEQMTGSYYAVLRRYVNGQSDHNISYIYYSFTNREVKFSAKHVKHRKGSRKTDYDDKYNVQYQFKNAGNTHVDGDLKVRMADLARGANSTGFAIEKSAAIPMSYILSSRSSSPKRVKKKYNIKSWVKAFVNKFVEKEAWKMREDRIAAGEAPEDIKEIKFNIGSELSFPKQIVYSWRMIYGEELGTPRQTRAKSFPVVIPDAFIPSVGTAVTVKFIKTRDRNGNEIYIAETRIAN